MTDSHTTESAPTESATTLEPTRDALERASDEYLDAPARLRWLGEAATLADRYYVQAVETRQTECTQHPSPEPSVNLPQTNEFGLIPELLGHAQQILADDVLPAIAEMGIQLSTPEQLDTDQLDWLASAFQAQIFPLLIPLAVDPGRPFPRLSDGGLNLLIVLRGQSGEPAFALLEDPDAIGRWLKVETPRQNKSRHTSWFSREAYQPGVYLWAEDVIRAHLDLLFPGMEIDASYLIRVLYAAPSATAPEPAAIPSAVETRVSRRVARLDIEEAMPEPVRRWLTRHLGAPEHTLVIAHPPMGMAGLMSIAEQLPVRKRGLFSWLNRIWRAIFRKA